MGATAVLGFALVMTAGALLLIALSFSTDHWIDYTVDRDGLRAAGASTTEMAENPLYFSRNRGLFRTCYPGNETTWLEDADDVVDKNCIREKGYEIDQDPDTINYDDDYDLRKHLMRAHVAFFACAMLLLLFGCIVGAVGCWRMGPVQLRAGGLLVFIAAFFSSGGMAFFHGYEYLEKQKISEVEFPKIWKELKPLGDYSFFDYGWSYAVAWVGTGLSFIAAILFLIAANIVITKMAKRKRLMNEKESSRGGKDKNAYDYMQEPGVYPYAPSAYDPYAANYDPTTMKSIYPEYPAAVDYSGYRY